MQNQFVEIKGKPGEYTGYYDTIYPIGCDPIPIQQVHCFSMYDGSVIRMDRDDAIRQGIKPFRNIETL